MKQIILTQNADGLWGYLVLKNGQLTGREDGEYDSPEDALEDAAACPTPA